MPGMIIKTQSVKQKCFESTTQSIPRLHKPRIKSYQIRSREDRRLGSVFTLCSMSEVHYVIPLKLLQLTYNVS